METPEESLELITAYFTGLTPVQEQQLKQLMSVYREWNSRINVISRKDEDSLYEKHVLHSLSIAAVFDFPDGMRVLDLGTGGGFPGIPLAIFFPNVKFYLVDSIGKKIKVVSAVAEALGLTNVETRHQRAEEIRDVQFDTVVSRAVAPLGELWKWSRPLLSRKTIPTSRLRTAGEEEALPVPHGLVCLKGGDLAQEIADSGCRPRQMEIYELFPREFFREKYVLYVPAR